MADKLINNDNSITVLVPLKKQQNSPSCPEVNRCQLIVEKAPPKSSLTIETTSDATKTTPASVTVSVGLQSKDSVCADTTVYVGMEKGSAPIAVGHHYNHNSQTYQAWERLIYGCIKPIDPRFPQRPLFFNQVRYLHDDQPISLMHYRFIRAQGTESEESLLAVRVWRAGNDFQRTFSAADNNVLSAAFSADFETLYIVSSTLSPPSVRRSVMYQKYVWLDGQWHAGSSASLDLSERTDTHLPFTVDSQGNIGGAFDTDVFSENGNDTNAGCYADYWFSNYTSYGVDSSVAMAFSIESGQWVTGTSLYLGFTISSDYEPIEAVYTLSVGGKAYYTYSRDNVGVEGNDIYDLIVEYNSVLAGMNAYDDVKIKGGISFGRMFDGDEYIAQTTWDMHSWNDDDPVNPNHHEGSLVVDVYSEKSGYRNISIMGSWVIVAESYTDRILQKYSDLLSGYGLNLRDCPPSGNDISYFQKPDDEYQHVVSHKSLHPIEISAYAFLNTFFINDWESGDAYYGALTMESEDSDPVWQVFKNGGDITSSLARCVDMSADSFSAIYFS